MKAVLLAAGRGERLRPWTDQTPKCMMPIGGKPLLEHTVEWLARFGIRELMINLHHLPERIRGYFGDGRRWGVRIHYWLEPELLGTAGALRRLEDGWDGPLLVWYGDNLSRCDLDRLRELHRRKGGTATLALYRRPDATSSGIAELDGEDRLVRFLEKPRPEEVFSHWVNAGIFLLEREARAFIPAEGPADFGRDVFPALLAAGRRMYGYRLSEAEGLWWIDTPEDLARTEGAWRERFQEVRG